jgi:hypothetical protein
MMDLKPFLETRPHGAQIDVFYVDAEDPRRNQALHLSGLPGIRLHPGTGLSHYLLRRVASSSQDFRGMLGDFLGVGPAAAKG